MHLPVPTFTSLALWHIMGFCSISLALRGIDCLPLLYLSLRSPMPRLPSMGLHMTSLCIICRTIFLKDGQSGKACTVHHGTPMIYLHKSNNFCRKCLSRSQQLSDIAWLYLSTVFSVATLVHSIACMEYDA